MGKMDRLDSLEIVREQALEDGYILARGAIHPALILRLREGVLQICARRNWLSPQFRGFANDSPEFLELQREVQQLPEFAELRESPELRGIVEKVIGVEFLSQQGDVCRVVHPNAPEFTTPQHQDQFFMNREEEIWIVWIPLGDCPREMGPLAVWPGSHRRGLLPTNAAGCIRSDEEIPWTSFDLACGDALLLHKLTVHRALPNTTDQMRLSVDYRFARAQCL